MRILAILFIVLALVSADTWTVIVSGSDGFMNYRHQSDACHAYQLHLRNGIPADNIILLAFDDIAYNPYNPINGTLYNRPGDDSPDNYEGCVIDYKGKHVTPEVYIAILTGDADLVTELTGITAPKVLQSNSDDKVFLSFFDHGSPGLIAFPKGLALSARVLNEAIVKMHQKQMYGKLVYYLEACESGSMFDKLLPKNIGVYATTAADPTESSWGTYCGNDAVVKGINIGSCLGDLYSVVWMEDGDRGFKKETLDESWKIILDEVTLSHPQQYGDLTYLDDLFFSFIGLNKAPRLSYKAKSRISWNSRDIEYKTFEYLSQHGHTEEIKRMAREDLKKTIEHMNLVDQRFLSITRELVDVSENRYLILTAKENIITEQNEDCYYNAVETYQRKCGLFDYDMKYMSTLLNICSLGKNSNVVNQVITSMCN